MTHKPGSKKNPLAIRQMCVRGDSSHESKPVLRKVLSNGKSKGDIFQMRIGNRRVWVELKPTAFRPRNLQLERSVNSGELGGVGVLITPLNEHSMRNFDVPEKSPTLYNVYRRRKGVGRVLQLTDDHFDLLMQTKPQRPPEVQARIARDLKKQVVEHIKKELELYEKHQ